MVLRQYSVLSQSLASQCSSPREVVLDSASFFLLGSYVVLTIQKKEDCTDAVLLSALVWDLGGYGIVIIVRYSVALKGE